MEQKKQKTKKIQKGEQTQWPVVPYACTHNTHETHSIHMDAEHARSETNARPCVVEAHLVKGPNLLDAKV